MKKWLLLLTLLLPALALADSYTPGVYNLTANQGEDYRKTVYVQNCADPIPPQNGSACKNRTPINLNGYRFYSLARANPTSGAILANISTAVDPSLGTVQLCIDRGLTALLGGKTGYWDLQVAKPDGTLTYLLKGQFYVAPTATR